MDALVRRDAHATPSAPGWSQRAAPLAVTGALAGAAVYVAGNDPSAANSRFPPCLFHSATGLWCPGCGLTRGVHALLRGHPLDALSFNLFTPLVVVVIAAAMFRWIATTWGRAPVRLSPESSRSLAIVAPAVLVAYGVLRNLPVTPFRALAP